MLTILFGSSSGDVQVYIPREDGHKIGLQYEMRKKPLLMLFSCVGGAIKITVYEGYVTEVAIA
jgi:hypothetical protein